MAAHLRTFVSLRSAILCLAVGLSVSSAPSLRAQTADSDHSGGMAHMAGHMYMTTLRPKQPGDQAKANAIVTAAKAAMEPTKGSPARRSRTATVYSFPTFRSLNITSRNPPMESRHGATSIPSKPTSLLYLARLPTAATNSSA